MASCLADWGTPVTASGFLGGKNDALFDRLFRRKGIGDKFVRLNEATRINITLTDDEATTNIYLPGLVVKPEDLEALQAELTQIVRGDRPDIAVLSGSLPVDCPLDAWAVMTRALTREGIRVLLDTSGPALKAALDGSVLPFCIKPNRGELAEISGASTDNFDAVVAQARRLHERGIGLVVVSLGADGALFLSDEGALVAAKEMKLKLHESTVGAGDAMVAGIAAALSEGAGLERIARLGTAFAVGKLELFGPNLPKKAHVEALAGEVTLTPLRK